MKPDWRTQDSCRSPAPTVADLRPGALARVSHVTGSGAAAQRVRMLGIRRGVRVRVLHGPDRRGAVLDVGGARIALGRALLLAIHVVPAGSPGRPGERPR